MKKSRLLTPVLVSLALATSLGGRATAQNEGAPKQPTLSVDKARNALLSVQDAPSSLMGLKVPFKASLGSDLLGLSTYTASLDLKSAVGKTDGTVNLYSDVNDKTALLLGDFKLSTPPELKLNLTADGKGQNLGSVNHFEGSAEGSLTASSPAPFSKLNLEGTNHTDYKSAQGKLSYVYAQPGLETTLPFTSANLTVTDIVAASAPAASGSSTVDASKADASKAAPSITTNLTIELTAKMSQQLGPAIKQLKDNTKPMAENLKGRLSQIPGIHIESVEFTKAEVTGDVASMSMTIKIKDLRSSLGMLAGLTMSQKDPSTAAASLEALKEMVQLQFTKFALSIKVDPGLASGSLDVDVNHLEAFLHGYNQLMGLAQEAASKQQLERARNDGEKMAVKWLGLVQKRAAELNRVTFQKLAEVGSVSDQSFSVNVEAKGADLSLKARAKSDTNHIDQVTAALKAANLPTLDKGSLLFSIKTEGGNLTGSFYLGMLGNVVETVKGLLVAPAQADADLKATADILANLKLQEAKMVGSLKDQKLEISGYQKTSDLTPAAQAVLAKLAPKLTATPDAWRMDLTGGERGNLGVRVHFKDFMAGKNASDIASAMGVDPSALKIETDVAGDKASIGAALTQPAVVMPPSLASLKATGDATLASGSGLAVPGGGSNTTTTIAIVAGAVVLLLVAKAAMGGRKA